jgi:hypothetical protein
MRKYLFGWFIIDFVSVFPFETLANENDWADVPALTKLLKLARLLRLLRMLRIYRIISRLEYALLVRHAASQVCETVVEE